MSSSISGRGMLTVLFIVQHAAHRFVTMKHMLLTRMVIILKRLRREMLLRPQLLQHLLLLFLLQPQHPQRLLHLKLLQLPVPLLTAKIAAVNTLWVMPISAMAAGTSSYNTNIYLSI
jgi:hypothetical protein